MKISLTFLLLLFISACASNSDFDLLRRDMNDLRRESSDAKKEIDSLKEKTVGTVKEDSFTALRESQAEINSRLTELSNNLQELRGRFEENKYFMEKALRDSSADKDVLKAQTAGLENQVKALRDKLTVIEELAKTAEPADKQTEDSKADAEKTPPGAETGEQPKTDTTNHEQAAGKKDVTEDKTKVYDEAYQAFKDKKYKEAREKFEAFIKNYSRNELTDNSQFWIAESHYSEKDYEDAILAYETLLKKYPDSDKTGNALLKQGLSFIEIGDTRTGRTILARLTEKFPNSKDATLAKKKLAELDKKSGRKK